MPITFRVDDILDRDGNTMERAPLRAWKLIQLPGLLEDQIGIEVSPGLHNGIAGLET